MYIVYTRKALKNGELRKGSRTFQSRAAQAKYIREAPMSVVITGWN